MTQNIYLNQTYFGDHGMLMLSNKTTDKLDQMLVCCPEMHRNRSP